MTIYTVHYRNGQAPVLVPEGFSFWALLFGPLWLVCHRAYIPAALALGAGLMIGQTLTGWVHIVLQLGILLLIGVSGRDLVRFSLDLRGFQLLHVLAASDADTALARLVTARPDLVDTFLPRERH